MTAADRIIRWTTAGAVVGVAAIAAVVSYEHASDLVREHGESGWTGRLIPLTELTDDSPLATLAQPKLTTVRQRVRERARPWPAWSPCPADRGHGLGLASKIDLEGQPDIRQAD